MLTRSRFLASKRLDARDFKILEIIQTSGCMSTKSLADRLGLSLTSRFQRLRRIEREGFIRGYRARHRGRAALGHAHPGLERRQAVTPLPIGFVALRGRRPADERNDRIMPTVVPTTRCGSWRVTWLHYQRIIERLLNRDVGIDKYFTYIVIRRIKEPSAIARASLLEEARITLRSVPAHLTERGGLNA